VAEQHVERAEGALPSESGPQQRGSQALADSLQLQRAAQKRAAAASGRGRRRKGEVIDLDLKTSTAKATRRKRIFMTLLVVEAIVAVIAVGVLVAYVLLQGDQIQ
jgi:hypothetical protein